VERFAFVFYATQWRRDLTWPLQCCLKSLEEHGGEAASYPRYLVYSEAPTPDIETFCKEYRITLQIEKRFTYRLAWPNKALMCRVPEHEAVCLLDLDLIFLQDPTPIFEETAHTGKIHSRLDLLVPLSPWPKLPEKWGAWLKERIGQPLWRGQYRRFGAGDFREHERPEGGSVPTYFNNGVNFIPGKELRKLGEAWRHVSGVFLRDIGLKRPYTFFFTHYFLDQICYAIAVHRAGIPWEVLPSAYNFIPVSERPEDRALLPGQDVVMAHMVLPVRHWLDPQDARAPSADLEPLYRRVRRIVQSVNLPAPAAR
jgi:hypothetical protein